MVESTIIKNEDEGNSISKKKIYRSPVMHLYGKLNRLTQGSNGNGMDANGTHTKHSDRRVKENIVKIGVHSTGIGLYLFDYKPEFYNSTGDGRQFGVMADEVETVMPGAVSIGSDGFKRVNYGMLGIELNS